MNKLFEELLELAYYNWHAVTGQDVDELINFLAYFINFRISYSHLGT